MPRRGALSIMIGTLITAAGLLAGAAQEPAIPARRQDPATTINVENRLTAQERAEGWKLLFDGKTTAGWRGYKQETVPDGWQAVDGALTRTRRAVDLITIDQFDSFELALEWKIAEKGNSGVMYHVSEDGASTYHTGPEVQVLDNHGHPDGKSPVTSAGSCFGLYAPAKDVTRPIGSWNELRIVVRGNRVEHSMNGERIVQYEIGSADWQKRVAESKFKQWPEFGRIARGHIALQEHGSQVAFRNIKIRVP